MASAKSRITCSFGDDQNIVTVKLGGTSKPVVVGLLGVEYDREGEPLTIYLDSLITRPTHDVTYHGWTPSGAISTILTRVNSHDGH